MNELEIIAVVFALLITAKGLIIFAAPKKFLTWAKKDYLNNQLLKYLLPLLGIIVMYYAVEGVPLVNVLSLIFAVGFLFSGFMLEFPKEVESISNKIIDDKSVKLLAAVSVVIGIAILYMFLLL
ncbi:MAG: hypothetical protein KAT91_01215 [Candidatus Aenigmarchaeota archaeon]|nr:hypothetical protein [Candidatus Aenigmarchaeota archaeon]